MSDVLRNLFSGRVWPNGEIGISVVRRVAVSTPKQCPLHPEAEWTRIALEVHGLRKVRDFLRARDLSSSDDGVLLPVRDDANLESEMGLSMVSNSHTRRGQRGITCHGSKVVRNGAFLLQKKYGNNRLSFLTCTVPGMDGQDLILLAKEWSRVVRVFVQKLRRRLKDHGLSGEIVGVTEIQEKRLRLRGEFALHLHLIFQGADRPYQWEIGKDEYREIWNSVLDMIVPRSRWSDEGSSTRVECIRFAAEGYIGKYMSKGRGSVQQAIAAGFAEFLPSSWYICTMQLRELIFSKVIKLFRSSADYVRELIETCPDIFEYLSVIKVQGRDREIAVGFCGRIQREFLHEVVVVIQAMNETEREKIMDLVENA